MKFEPCVCIVPNMRAWAAHQGGHSFMITIDDNYGGEIEASAKPRDAIPFDGTLHQLGKFPTMAAAESACRHFAKRQEN